MVDSIGRFPVGRYTMRRKIRNSLERTIQKMEQWRDKARINLFQQRARYEQKVKSNQALMDAKKACKPLNLNPGVTKNLGDRPSRKYAVTHSTVPLKPRYSLVEPAERIYGNLWKKFEGKP